MKKTPMIEDPKKKTIVETATALFMRYGVRRVTVEEICRESCVSKMTFYKHFSNKVELAKAIIDEIITKNMRIYRELMDRDIPFSEKVNELIHLKREASNMFSQEFLNDLWKNPEPEIAEQMHQYQSTAYQELMDDFKTAQDKGEIRQGMNLNFLMFMLNLMPDLAMRDELQQMYDNPQDLIMELTEFFFYGIQNREDD
jgi:AcrR family transcriptional regulator